MTAKTKCSVFRCVLLVAVSAATAPPAMAAAPPPLRARARWFRHDRFGMFIHWGVYSILGKGEWIQHTGQIPLAEYEKLFPKFNPVGFDADKWVALAKQAGQKYIVITTKHHDGFCMFDSKLTDYDIMSTPFKRDVIREMTDACRRAGLKIGFYYSIMDWHHPDYLPRRKWDKDRSSAGADFDRYVAYMRGQIRELLTNYGPIDILWFDGGWEHKEAADREKFADIVRMARRLQPHILVNNRANIGGDFQTPEQYIPATGLRDAEGKPALWEACMTMTTGHGSFAPTAWWGYDAHETVFKSTEELVRKLIDVASKGGNFLLNIGPKPDGRIRSEEVERLEGIGRWMRKYGRAIQGTSAGPFRVLPFLGRVTQAENTLYVHVFQWPSDRRLVLPGLTNEIVRAHLLGDETTTIATSRPADRHDWVLTVPAAAPDAIASVVVLELKGKPVVEPVSIRPSPDGVVTLPVPYAEIQARHGQRARIASHAGRTFVANWSNPNDVVVWRFTLPKAGTYAVRLDARPASEKAIGRRVEVRVADQELSAKITRKGVEFGGRLKIPAGDASLSVRLLDAKRTGPPILELSSVRLVPAAP